MCFKSKMKVPKATPDQLTAPEPKLLEPPKGVEVGDPEVDGGSDTVKASSGISSLKVEKTKGDGSQSVTSTDTGLSSSSAIKRALKR